MKRASMPPVVCTACGRNPERVNNPRSECSLVVCPHRLREPVQCAGMRQVNGASGCYRVEPSCKE
jgi:hypothetical protein